MGTKTGLVPIVIKKKYKTRKKFMMQGRMAKCGHYSKSGRYYNCEVCKPVLESDEGDWIYYGSTEDNIDSD